MPLMYLRSLTNAKRTDAADRHLSRYLALIAGATNAGGFLAVHQYTSHMSGIVSSMADDVAIGRLGGVLSGLAAVLAFLLGAFATTLLVRWARARTLESVYALPLLAEATLLLVFGLTGSRFAGGRVLGTVLLLCFTMGLQNAIVSKLSSPVIRTTHLTGMVTDLGIALGRVASARLTRKGQLSAVDLQSLRLLGSLVGLFFAGGVVGAIGFEHVGFLFTLPLAGGLVLLAAVPVVSDLRRRALPRPAVGEAGKLPR